MEKRYLVLLFRSYDFVVNNECIVSDFSKDFAYFDDFKSAYKYSFREFRKFLKEETFYLHEFDLSINDRYNSYSIIVQFYYPSFMKGIAKWNVDYKYNKRNVYNETYKRIEDVVKFKRKYFDAK